jgi:hypothetical protein
MTDNTTRPFQDNLPGLLQDNGDEDWLEWREEHWKDVSNRVIVSLFDHSGEWSRPYREAGYQVVHFDIKEPGGFGWSYDIADFSVEFLTEELGLDTVYGILAAPPCTHFTVSGAQYWPEKDADGRTDAMIELVYTVFRCVELFAPKFWVFENPVGRLPKLIPELGRPWYFQPHWFGDAYTKKTGLWGRFYTDLERNDVEPVRACEAGSWLMKLGGKSEKTKALRSVTPPGFAQAFFGANQ